MSILAIDAGNSRIKWGLSDVAAHEDWLRSAWLTTADAATLGDAIREAITDLPPPTCIVISNVAGDAVRESIMLALEHLKVPPLWIAGASEQCGVRSGYADPRQLGSDRWAGVIAAWHRYGTACVVVNAGTTMTVDALSAEGVFLGGVIVPGLDLMRASLARGTAQLKLAPGAFCYFPDNTADAIMSGAINALTGAIERMRSYMEQTGQSAPLIVLSGGTATQIEPQLTRRSVVVDNLVLEGLRVIARQESQKGQ